VDDQERWYLDNLPLEGAVIADVGANVGRLSQFFWEHGGKNCRVISIEPQPENVQVLRTRIADSGADNWSVEACAVAATTGTVQMQCFDVEYGKNSVIVEDGVEGGVDASLRSIDARRLTDLVPDATVVKLDIEGHEYAILPDALRELKHVKAWALELHMMEGHPLETTLQMLRDHGYELYAAGRKRDDPNGPWLSAPLPAGLSWAQFPGTKTTLDGVPGMFKMLHVLALKDPT
jgi:FkbM family methyltransferase